MPIAIAANGASVSHSFWRSYITNTTSVSMRVPKGVHLNLRVGQGQITIGEDYLGGTCIRRPVAAESIIARNESKVTGGPFGLGNIVIETVAPRDPADGGPLIRRLDVQATGQIEIQAHDDLIEFDEPPSRSAVAPAMLLR